jgi:hypothetical protein
LLTTDLSVNADFEADFSDEADGILANITLVAEARVRIEDHKAVPRARGKGDPMKLSMTAGLAVAISLLRFPPPPGRRITP